MADNRQLPATGTGTADIVVATDDIGGVNYQRVKLSLGADGTAADAPVGGGTESGVLRVTVASDSTGVLSVKSLSTTILATVVTVGTTGVTLPASALAARRAITIQSDPTNTAYIYLGSSAVTADAASTGGFMLAPGQSIPIELAVGLVIYGRSTVASQVVRVLEFA